MGTGIFDAFLLSLSSFQATTGAQPVSIQVVAGHPPMFLPRMGVRALMISCRNASQMPKDTTIATAAIIPVFIPNFLYVCTANIPAKKKSPKPSPLYTRPLIFVTGLIAVMIGVFGKITSTGSPRLVNEFAAVSIAVEPITKIMSMDVKRTAKSPTVFQLNNELRYKIIKTAKVKPKTSMR